MVFRFAYDDVPAAFFCDECEALILELNGVDEIPDKSLWKNGSVFCADCVEGIEELPPEAFLDEDEFDDE